MTKKINEVKRAIYQVNPVNIPCSLSDAKVGRLIKIHNNHKGHIKTAKLLKKANEGLDEEFQFTMAEVIEFVNYCGYCQKMSWTKPIHRTKYEPSVEHDRFDTRETDVFEPIPGYYVMTVLNLGSGEILHYWMGKDNSAKSIIKGWCTIRAMGMKIQRTNLRLDKGPNQTADEVQRLLTMLNIDIQFGIAGSHEDNSEPDLAVLLNKVYMITEQYSFTQISSLYGLTHSSVIL
jgi:hypothetical protein